MKGWVISPWVRVITYPYYTNALSCDLLTKEKTTINPVLVSCVIYYLVIVVFLIEECGIVAQISEPLVKHNISEYYLSTYYNDHSLVNPYISHSSYVGIFFG